MVLGTTQTQPVQQIPRSTYGKLMVPLIALCDNVPGEVKGSGTGEEGGQGGASRLHTTPVGLLPSPSSASLIVTRSVAASSWPRQLAVIRTHPMRSTCKATPETCSPDSRVPPYRLTTSSLDDLLTTDPVCTHPCSSSPRPTLAHVEGSKNPRSAGVGRVCRPPLGAAAAGGGC